MSVILYARVSTGKQAEKEFSIPAQIRAMKTFAQDRGLMVAGVHQDIGSVYSLKERPGLMAALRQIKNDVQIRGLVVHKVDRLSRNIFRYLTIKGKLKAQGVNIVSVVEHFEDNPMGEFIEHIMAAQAEFFSANLSLETKKGLSERLHSGKWNGVPTVGYLTQDGMTVIDPARSQFIRRGFEFWATGTVTAREIAKTTHAMGLVSRTGGRIGLSTWCRILKDPFYSGMMRTRSGMYQGVHMPIVSKELFEECQAVFRRKQPKRGGISRRHQFLLSALVRCPTCPRHLAGEVHKKQSGRIYRYYRCQRRGCRFTAEAGALDRLVISSILNRNYFAQLIPIAEGKATEEKRKLAEQHREHTRRLRSERDRLEKKLGSLAQQLAEKKIRLVDFGREQDAIRHAIEQTEFLRENIERATDGEATRKLNLLLQIEKQLSGNDILEQRKALVELVLDISVISSSPDIMLKPEWLMATSASSNSHQGS